MLRTRKNTEFLNTFDEIYRIYSNKHPGVAAIQKS